MKVVLGCSRIANCMGNRKHLINNLISKGHEVLITYYESPHNIKLLDNVRYQQLQASRNSITILGDIRLLLHYIRLFLVERPDIYHSYTTKPNIYGTIAAKLTFVKGVYPVINGLGDSYTIIESRTGYRSAAFRFLYRMSFALSSKVFFQNQHDLNLLADTAMVNRDKCIYIAGSGIDLKEHHYIPYTNKKLSFLMASRLVKSKGVIDYCEAARILKKQYQEVEFVLCGRFENGLNGISESDLSPYINDSSIIYKGHVDNINHQIADCLAFILPTYYREGVPHSILEAMAIGRAVLTTDMPGCTETVIEGYNGFIIQPKRIEALTEKMTWFINNVNETVDMGKNSRKLAERVFDVRAVNKTILRNIGICKT
ncbi:glycosyl transferase [Clostridia bacterium]|nr:glycosyl transferase [Clostridia bacterium]